MLVAVGAERTMNAIETSPRAPGDRSARRHAGRHLPAGRHRARPPRGSARRPRRCTSCSTTSPAPASSPVSRGHAGSPRSAATCVACRRSSASARAGSSAPGCVRAGGHRPRARRARIKRMRSDSRATSRPPTIRWHGTSSPSGRRCACAAIAASTFDQDGDALFVDSFFRDSCWEPDGTEMALHEYTVEAEVDAASQTLTVGERPPARVAVPRVPVGRAARRPARRHARRRLPHQRAGDTGRAAVLHAPQRHAALSGGGSVARRRARRQTEPARGEGCLSKEFWRDRREVVGEGRGGVPGQVGHAAAEASGASGGVMPIISGVSARARRPRVMRDHEEHDHERGSARAHREPAGLLVDDPVRQAGEPWAARPVAPRRPCAAETCSGGLPSAAATWLLGIVNESATAWTTTRRGASTGSGARRRRTCTGRRR